VQTRERSQSRTEEGNIKFPKLLKNIDKIVLFLVGMRDYPITKRAREGGKPIWTKLEGRH